MVEFTFVPCHWIEAEEKSYKPVAINIKSYVTILWWTKRQNLRRAVPVGTMDVEYTDTRIGILTN